MAAWGEIDSSAGVLLNTREIYIFILTSCKSKMIPRAHKLGNKTIPYAHPGYQLYVYQVYTKCFQWFLREREANTYTSKLSYILT